MEKTCKNCGTPITKEYCEDNYPEVCEHWTPKKPKTNADCIRAMSDEELVQFIGHNSLCDRIQSESNWCDEHAVCENCLMEWLQQPAEEE